MKHFLELVVVGIVLAVGIFLVVLVPLWVAAAALGLVVVASVAVDFIRKGLAMRAA